MNIWALLARGILKFRLPILLSILGISVVMAYFATKVEMTYALPRILPADDPESVYFEEFKKRFGEDGNVMVIGFESPDFYNQSLFSDWFNTISQIKTIEGVKNVLSIADLYNIHRNDSLKKLEFYRLVKQAPENQQQADSIKNVIESLPFYKGLLWSELNSQKATLAAITLDNVILDKKDRKDLVENVKKVSDAFAEKQNIELHYSGLPYIRTINAIKIKFEIGLFLGLSLLVTAIVLFLFFRSFKAIIFPMLVVLLSVIWCLGTLTLLGYKITILTGLIPPLIVIIGIPNCIFLTNQYHREFRGHGNKVKAIARVVRRIGNATFLTNFNTALGFVTFGFTESKILSEFGVLSSINVMQVFVLSITILPIVYSYIQSPKPKQTKHLDNKFFVRVTEWLIQIVLRFRPLIYLITAILVAVSLYGVTKTKSTGNFTDDIPKTDVLIKDLHFFENRFNGVMPFEVTIDTKQKNGVLKLSNLRKADKLQNLLKKYPEFSKPISIVEVIKFARQSFYDGDSAFYALPDNEDVAFLLEYAQNTGIAQNKVAKSFIDSANQVMRISVQMADIGTTEMQRIKDELQPQIDSIFNPEKYNVRLTGSSIIFLKGTDYLVENLMMSLLAAIVLISGLMYFMFYSWKMLLVSVIPNLIPLVFTAALMGFYGISLKTSTILVFNIAYGITVDSAIHFFSRYGLELKLRKYNMKQAVIATMRDTNVSIIYTSIILFLGFGIFLFSNFGGTIALGFLVSFTILTGLFTNLLLLPTILLSMDKAFKLKSYREPLIMVYDEEEDINLDSLTIKKNEHYEDDEEN